MPLNGIALIKYNYFKKLILLINLILLVFSLTSVTSCKNVISPFDLNTVQNINSSTSIKDSIGSIKAEENFFKLKNDLYKSR